MKNHRPVRAIAFIAMPLLIFSIAAMTAAVRAQTTWATSGNDIYNTNSGGVLIGTTTSGPRLYVVGEPASGGGYSTAIGFVPSWASSVVGGAANIVDTWFSLGGSSTAGTVNGYQSNGGNTGSASLTNFHAFVSTQWPSGTVTNNYGFRAAGVSGTNNYGVYVDHAKSYFGNSVCIGTTDPQGYKLAVNGSMIATSVKVKTYANWPDYVFAPAYRPRSLGELERYVNLNGHLPEVPSAEEVKKDGIDLADMNARLLKKIEELTLYLIAQDKKINDLSNTVQKLSPKPRK